MDNELHKSHVKTEMQFTPASADVVPKTNKEDAVQAPQFRVVSTQIPIGGFKKMSSVI
jgi:uncharacterized protein (DUF736 family)